jgi:hypothetical protein
MSEAAKNSDSNQRLSEVASMDDELQRLELLTEDVHTFCPTTESVTSIKPSLTDKLVGIIEDLSHTNRLVCTRKLGRRPSTSPDRSSDIDNLLSTAEKAFKSITQPTIIESSSSEESLAQIAELVEKYVNRPEQCLTVLDMVRCALDNRNELLGTCVAEIKVFKEKNQMLEKRNKDLEENCTSLKPGSFLWGVAQALRGYTVSWGSKPERFWKYTPGFGVSFNAEDIQSTEWKILGP